MLYTIDFEKSKVKKDYGIGKRKAVVYLKTKSGKISSRLQMVGRTTNKKKEINRAALLDAKYEKTKGDGKSYQPQTVIRKNGDGTASKAKMEYNPKKRMWVWSDNGNAVVPYIRSVVEHPDSRGMNDNQKFELMKKLSEKYPTDRALSPGNTNFLVSADPGKSGYIGWSIGANGKVSYHQTKEQRKEGQEDIWERTRNFMKNGSDYKIIASWGKKAETDDKYAAAYMLALTGMRIDSSDIEDKDTVGALQLGKKHIRIKGDTIHFKFRGKGQASVKGRGQKYNEYHIKDKTLAKIFNSRKGKLLNVEYNDVKSMIQTEASINPHDLRRRVCTLAAANVLSKTKFPKELDEKQYKKFLNKLLAPVAACINDTVATVLDSYIDPVVLNKWKGGKLK